MLQQLDTQKTKQVNKKVILQYKAKQQTLLICERGSWQTLADRVCNSSVTGAGIFVPMHYIRLVLDICTCNYCMLVCT